MESSEHWGYLTMAFPENQTWLRRGRAGFGGEGGIEGGEEGLRVKKDHGVHWQGKGLGL